MAKKVKIKGKDIAEGLELAAQRRRQFIEETRLPKPLTGYKKAVADLRIKEDTSPMGKYLKFDDRFERWEYAKSLEIAHPGRIKVFQATTNGMNNNAQTDIKQGDYVAAKELNRFKWIENLKKPEHLFVIETQDVTTITQIIDYNEDTGVITCFHWGSRLVAEDYNISDLKNLYVVIGLSKDFIKASA